MPGQKEARYAHLLREEGEQGITPAPEGPKAAPPDEIAELRRELAELREEVAALRARLEAERPMGRDGFEPSTDGL